MRRSDREVTSKDEMIKILEKCDVCRLAMSNDDIPYVVPMNFGFEYNDDALILYFHCANEGKKIELLNKNPNVCFEMDCSHKLVEGEEACDYTMEYESIIGNGIVNFISEKSEKINALKFLMKKYAPEKEFEFSGNHVNAVAVFKVVARDVTGKRLIK